jgi:hypothetical protein
MAFDPDKYLAQAKPVVSGFDPNAYLGITGSNIINTDVPTVVSQTPQPAPVAQPRRTMMDRVKALYEVPLTAGSAMLAAPISSAAGAISNVMSPEFGTQQGIQQGQDVANRVAQQMTYTPTSPVTQDILQGVGQMAEAAKLPPIIPTTGMLPSYARMMGAAQPQVSQAAQTARQVVPTMPDLLRRQPQPTMAGVGSAATPEAVTRTQMASQLRVPVPLSKGQAERDLGQQQFEIETPKIAPELGKPLVEAQARRNDAILQNFDAFVDATGKQSFGLRATGKAVTDVLNKEAEAAKTKINQAYTLAKEKGETEAPVNYTQLQSFIENETPTTRTSNAQIIIIFY